MDEVLEYLRKCDVYYIATIHDGKPEVRPFSTISKFDDKLYFQTGKVKDVYKQLIDNPHVAISACGDGDWIRISATAVPDETYEASAAVLHDYPSLKKMYAPDDGNCIVFYLKDAVATFSGFTKMPRTVEF